MSLTSVLHALWQSALLAALLWGLVKWRAAWSAESRYWIWSATLLVIALLPLLTLLPRSEATSSLALSRLALPAVAAAGDSLVQAVPLATLHTASITRQVAKWLPALWLALVVWRLLVLARAALTLSRWRHAARVVPLARLPLPSAAFARCDVRESADITSPAVVGLLNPCILLPRQMPARLQTSQLTLVLLHELAHIQRRDGWFTLVQRLIEALYFYNPVVHWVSAQIERERESSCDDRAIRAANETGLQYAECLVHVSREAVTSRMPSLAVGAVGGQTQLAHRVRRLLDRSETEETRASWRSVGLGVCVLVVAALALSSIAPRAVADDKAEYGDGTALIEAARDGNLPLVQRLLERGADVNQPVPRDGNPLIVAAARGHLEVAKTLVEHGADVNAFVPEDETPLINAAREGHLEVVTYLLEKGADINLAVLANGTEMRSPLGEARKHQHPDVANLLLQQGAKP
jgi:bla regulator protein BlaR1